MIIDKTTRRVREITPEKNQNKKNFEIDLVSFLRVYAPSSTFLEETDDENELVATLKSPEQSVVHLCVFFHFEMFF